MAAPVLAAEGEAPLSTPDLIAELEVILGSPGRNRLEHPLIVGIEKGELTREQIAGWIFQITSWANPTNYLFGAMYARAADEDLRRMVLDNMLEEEHGTYSGTQGHIGLFESTFSALGWTPERRATEEIKQETWALAHWFELVMTQRPFVEAVAATSFSAERINPRCFSRIEKSLRQKYGLSEAEVLSIAVHASDVEDEHGSMGPTAFARYATTVEEQNGVRFAVAHTSELLYRQWMTYIYY